MSKGKSKSRDSQHKSDYEYWVWDREKERKRVYHFSNDNQIVFLSKWKYRNKKGHYIDMEGKSSVIFKV